MWRIIRKTELENLKFFEQQWEELYTKNQKLNQILTTQNDLISNLKFKLKGTKSTVYAIRKDRQENDSFICVQDKRKINKDSYTLEGDLNIFVLSSFINPQPRPEMYHDMPYLETTFYESHITLDEVHSYIYDISYENQGYGTMMLDTLVDIARQSGHSKIIGRLSSEDAKEENEKENRNKFYRNYKKAITELTFDDNTETKGHFKILL